MTTIDDGPAYVLEINDERPRRYRLSVLQTPAEHLKWMVDKDKEDGFKIVCQTNNANEAFTLIERYVRLEMSA